jgi:hypothetical protein
MPTNGQDSHDLGEGLFDNEEEFKMDFAEINKDDETARAERKANPMTIRATGDVTSPNLLIKEAVIKTSKPTNFLKDLSP